ncbi:hydroxymyristoyl-ACP dehydratase [Ottowia sp.]|uniref:hydroxymyristoyl-ACP dehydratase n=1 Tax=Ottowia sp. TaxID=1898956 RepID=UPI0039E4911E
MTATAFPHDDAVFQLAAGQGRDWIAARVPHQGRMCLLDGVLHADAGGVTCRTLSHRQPDHPMHQGGRLGATCGIEYAAQAMALHGALAAEARGAARPKRGFLISVRSVALHVPRLDDVPGAITVQVRADADNGDHSVYAFFLSAGAQCLVEGRAVVMLDAPSSASS